ncbi:MULTISPECIES: hypothetical protein [Streptomycetaceae]|uniref:Uncharacterized protein n=1 Tax=Streptantibioticus cattleyicolor (strain ATCC 35852 / DSM 46488 / JCM 4925 / NBRC 14057 / NRRL 8057) TaxID=1003195 RepID=F8K0B6_STREN|nr:MULTISPECIES: hypothetical protein [Streptomycetaceae]AEW96096.1 hypothetical protein SCATT_37250 [Streptantibioticus cattleyicolor NRRL 8057 = DSM 46488]MYS60628.1 hypothetical protein [Streptomyces sp. SID5468]CCB76436.1 protein of unknown function [Streptantibioticus cattleyicolor NRRL 8057 = DSM 46488]
MTGRCGWCREPRNDLVAVGFHPATSAGGVSVYACAGCVAARQLLPLAEHPVETDGTPRIRPSTTTTTRTGQ